MSAFGGIASGALGGAALGPIGMIGGGILGGLGSYFQGQSQNRAARRADDDNELRLRAQQGLLGSGFFGSGYGGMPYYQTIYGQGLASGNPNDPRLGQGLAGINSFVQSQGGPIQDQFRRLAESVSQRQSGNLGYYDQDTARLGGMSQGLLNEYDRGAANIYGNALGAEGMARDWGRNNANIINRQSAADLEGANRQSNRDLNSRGLGNSTVLSQARAGNQARTSQQRNDALQGNYNSQIDRLLGARAQTLGVQTNLHNTRAGLAQNQMGRDYQRAEGRMNLENANLTRDIGLRQDPIQLAYQTLSGNVFNPYSQQNYAPPGLSASGLAMSTAGNLLSRLGGQNWFGNNFRDYADQWNQAQNVPGVP